MLAEVLADIHVPRIGAGRARTRPSAVLADHVYATGVNRDMLRGKGIIAVTPEKSTQISSHKKCGSNGGRSPAFDAELYKDRNIVERSFAWTKQWRGLAARYDKLAITYRAGATLNALLN